MDSEHKYIWLQPECCADPDEGRHWCQDPDPVECDDGKPWTKYILASEHEALERQLGEVRGELEQCNQRVKDYQSDVADLEAANESLAGNLERATAELTTLRQSLQRAAEERDGFMKIALELCNHDEGWLAAKYVEVTKPLPASDVDKPEGDTNA